MSSQVQSAIIIAAATLWLSAAFVSAVRTRSATGLRRGRYLWLTWGVVATAAVSLAGIATSLLVHWPSTPAFGLASAILLIPLSVLLGRSNRVAVVADQVLVHTLVITGLVGLVGAVYLLVVIGLGRVPAGEERTVLALSMGAAAVTSMLVFPTRQRLVEWANQRVYHERHSPDEALRTFGTRMSRSVPMDELLLQLVETLRKTMHLSSAEIWIMADGRLTRSVSVLERSPTHLRLNDEETIVVARAHSQGNAWIQVWIPGLLAGRDHRILRSVSLAHLGELLGLIVVERRDDDTPFTDEEDQVLVELARQVGLALHNVRLDSALQASLDELQVRNAELVASRARIVATADESRRQIERNLHDGAQQHLVALAVKVGLVKTLMASDTETATGLLDELRTDVQATLTELRELAHGIYPPLLRDRGLREALTTAANRATLVTVVEADVDRFDTDVEAAVYFCCLEAMQNAGKHAGETATVMVTVGRTESELWFEVSDDGAGFETNDGAEGHGFVNMRDRLGALDGSLTVNSVVGSGTTIRGTIPLAVSPAATHP